MYGNVRRFLAGLLGATLAGSTGGGCASHENALSSIVFVQVTTTSPEFSDEPGISEGTGVVIDNDGHILTCYHLVSLDDSVPFLGKPWAAFEEEEADVWTEQERPPVEIQVVLHSGTPRATVRRADLVRTYPSADLALLKVRGPDRPEPIRLAKRASVADPVWALGFPDGSSVSFSSRGPEPSSRSGTVTAVRLNNPKQVVLVEHGARLMEGMSGGALVNRRGELVGVNFRGSKDGEEQAIGFGLVRLILDNALGRRVIDAGLLGLRPNATLRVLDVGTRRPEPGIPLPLLNHRAPAWSPDGRQLAYESFQDERNDVYVREAPSGRIEKLTGGLYGHRAPAWSRRSDRVAVTTIGRNQTWLEVFGRDGTPLQTIRARGRSLANATWSPDDRRLCAEERTGETSRLVLVDLQAGSIAQIPLPLDHAATPHWSARGNRIAFAGGSKRAPDIYSYDLDRRSLSRLTSLPGAELTPQWSCDGRRVAFTTAAFSRQGVHEVVLLDLASRQFDRVWGTPANTFGPAWSPDCSRMAFYEIALLDQDR